MVKVGDKVKLAYISDCNPKNDEIGTVIFERMYKYYPNGNPEEFIWKQQCTIQYSDDSTMDVQDTEFKGCGILSPLVKVA